MLDHWEKTEQEEKAAKKDFITRMQAVEIKAIVNEGFVELAFPDGVVFVIDSSSYDFEIFLSRKDGLS